MGRLARKGLEYFSIDTAWETSVRLIKAKYGALEGVGFLTEIWASIYRENYYRPWNEETELLFADEIKKDPAWVHEVIEFCLDKKIFDREVFSAQGVLTSHGIQKRYFKIARDSLKRTNLDYIPGITYPEYMPENNPGGKADNPGGNRDNPGGKADNPGGYDHKARQGNSIQLNTSMQACREQPVDNSVPPDDGFDDDGFGDLPALPAAALSMSAERVKTALALTPAKLAVRDLDAIALRLSAHGLDEAFIAWAVKKSTDRAVRNPGAFLRSGLLGSGEFASWPEEYRLETRKPEAMRRAPAPEICPHCGDPLRKTTDRAGCTCGAMWEYDPGRDEWAEQGFEEEAG